MKEILLSDTQVVLMLVFVGRISIWRQKVIAKYKDDPRNDNAYFNHFCTLCRKSIEY